VVGLVGWLVVMGRFVQGGDGNGGVECGLCIDWEFGSVFICGLLDVSVSLKLSTITVPTKQ